MLTILITFAWLNAEAAALGIKVSDSEARRQFARFQHEVIGDDATFQRYLKYTGETLADELLVSRMDLISTRLQQNVIKMMGLAGARRFFHAFPRRWAAKTSCSAGYVIPDCKQYKGPLPPETSI